jgi:hypothetical protein
MAASSRVRKACSPLRRALWLTTFIAALLHCGMCLQSSDLPHPAVPTSAEPGSPGALQTPSSQGGDAQYRADDDDGGQGPGQDAPPGHRHHHAVLRAPSLRTDVAAAVGPLLTGAPPDRPHDTRLIEPRGDGEPPERPAGASLLTMIGISRT